VKRQRDAVSGEVPHRQPLVNVKPLAEAGRLFETLQMQWHSTQHPNLEVLHYRVQ